MEILNLSIRFWFYRLCNPLSDSFFYLPQSTSTPKLNRNVYSSAHVLTSASAIAIMEVKEKKKQDEILAKEQRKKESEEKRKLKETEAKKKVL